MTNELTSLQMEMIDARMLEGHMGVFSLLTLERASRRQRTRFQSLGRICVLPFAASTTESRLSHGSSRRAQGRRERAIVLDDQESQLDRTRCDGVDSVRHFICDNI